MSSKADPLGKRRSPKAGSAKARKRGGPRTMQQVALTWEVNGLIAGVDEAGRGPLAGPVVAAAVIMDDLHPIKGLADSKKLTALQRDRLYDEIRGKALCYAVAQASVQEIDELNILQATLLAMRRAVLGLRLLPKLVLVDGNRLPVLPMRAEAIVQGDDKVAAISAASVLAKVTRDRCRMTTTSGTSCATSSSARPMPPSAGTNSAQSISSALPRRIWALLVSGMRSKCSPKATPTRTFI